MEELKLWMMHAYWGSGTIMCFYLDSAIPERGWTINFQTARGGVSIRTEVGEEIGMIHRSPFYIQCQVTDPYNSINNIGCKSCFSTSLVGSINFIKDWAEKEFPKRYRFIFFARAKPMKNTINKVGEV